MTTIFNKYHESISNGTIDIYNNVNLSVAVCDKTYTPNESDVKSDINGIIQTYVNLLIEKDICTLSMGDIVDRVYNKLDEELKKNAYRFVVYDTETNILCFCEEFHKMNMM